MTTTRISAAEFRAGPKKKDRLGSVAKRTEYAGVMYASKGEARFAEKCDGWKRDRVIVSEPFANKHGLHAGDALTLPLGGHMVKATVAGVYYDLTENLALMGDVGWQNWSAFGKVDVSVDSAGAHLGFPGFGTVRRSGDRFTIEAV
jgi:long-subunit fatty acid transport protein